ncbi:5576_t:CDS:2 [Cetraspora pellucida]|uniref:5576_t:CDS:1 n=1 Tax=Cetraspora pellucida TaxID=1433469 RepID=A0A9N9IJT5_9GLOM|nr:5576_t:CDS:2 [Cetraspora pellucida]
MKSAKITDDRTIWVRKMFQRNLKDGTTFDNLMKDLVITNTADGKISAEMLIQEHHLNRRQLIHGGMLALMTDVCGMLAVYSKGMHNPGSSTDINISYLSSVGNGDTLLMDAECIKLGKNLAFTIVEIRNKADRKVVAQGRHTLFVANAHNDPENLFKIVHAKM